MKGSDEYILDYISGVQDFRFAGLDEDQLFYQDFSRNRPHDLVRLALDSFVGGVPPSTRTRLQLHVFDTLEEAFDQAVLVEKQINRDRLRFTEQKTPKLTCQLCDRIGHDARSCRSNQGIVSQPPMWHPSNRVAEHGYRAHKPLLPY